MIFKINCLLIIFNSRNLGKECYFLFMGLISTLCYVLSYKNLKRLKLCFIPEGYMQNFNISNFNFADQFEIIEFIASEIIRNGNVSNDIEDYQVTNVSMDDSIAIITIY